QPSLPTRRSSDLAVRVAVRRLDAPDKPQNTHTRALTLSPPLGVAGPLRATQERLPGVSQAVHQIRQSVALVVLERQRDHVRGPARPDVAPPPRADPL